VFLVFSWPELEYTMYRFRLQALFSIKLFLSTLPLIGLPYKPDPVYITLLNFVRISLHLYMLISYSTLSLIKKPFHIGKALFLYMN
ncbi:hypothetical protein BK122_00005, partial [Paenibacillus pabuli]